MGRSLRVARIAIAIRRDGLKIENTSATFI
jgi:hypothetical protein